MRLYPLCLPLLLNGCCELSSEPITLRPDVPADLLQPCAGYTGPVPKTEGQLSDALIAEVQGRSCANRKLGSLAEILIQTSQTED